MTSPEAEQHFELGVIDARPYREKVTPKPRLKDICDDHFEVVHAKTSEQREIAFRLRYQVYCIENPYEDPASAADEMERDCYDPASLHAVLTHRSTGSPVGTVRLILPEHQGREIHLPIRTVCQHEYVVHGHSKLPRGRTAEISRFAVSKDFRRRAQEDASINTASAGHDPRRIMNNISLGLMQGIVGMAERAGVTHLCAIMEPILLRMLRQLGIHFHNIGPTVDYHGVRQPCYNDLDELLTRVWLTRPDVWELLTDEGKLWPLNIGLAAIAQVLTGSSPHRTVPMPAWARAFHPQPVAAMA